MNFQVLRTIVFFLFVLPTLMWGALHIEVLYPQ